MSTLAQDRYTRLAALRPARHAGTAGGEAPRGHAPDIPEGAGRLAQLLGAAPQRNRFGEHLALRRWFSEAIGGDATLTTPALRLIAPDAPDCIADPQQWLFLDTETTGLAGG